MNNLIPNHFQCPICNRFIIGHKIPLYKGLKMINEICIDCWNDNHISNFEELINYYLHNSDRNESINEDRRK